MKPRTLKHEFVQHIPDKLEEGVLYVSIPFATAVHKCCCGCGTEIVTPITPTDWQLTFDGETITLYPSIGNWNLPCQAHYWIRHNTVQWARRWTTEEIRAGKDAKQEYDAAGKEDTPKKAKGPRKLWHNVKKRFS